MKLRLIGTAAIAGILAATAVMAQGVDLKKVSTLRNAAALNEKAPEVYKAKFDTSQGAFVIEVRREWAPNGADRFYNLVKNGFYDEVRFFRVVPDFMVQFGINGNPQVQSVWRTQTIKDDPVKQGNKKGYVTFATSGPDSRSTQVFVNFKDNSFLDSQKFAAFGRVTEGMAVVEKITAQYGEKPNQGAIQTEGNVYLNKEFPKLDFVKTATIVP
jgi:peptidyl-prolyl cis-trans isomerase A (cyclophilin A)